MDRERRKVEISSLDEVSTRAETWSRGILYLVCDLLGLVCDLLRLVGGLLLHSEPSHLPKLKPQSTSTLVGLGGMQGQDLYRCGKVGFDYKFVGGIYQGRIHDSFP